MKDRATLRFKSMAIEKILQPRVRPSRRNGK